LQHAFLPNHSAETSHCVDLTTLRAWDGQFLFWQSQLFANASPFSIVETMECASFYFGTGFIT